MNVDCVFCSVQFAVCMMIIQWLLIRWKSAKLVSKEVSLYTICPSADIGGDHMAVLRIV